MKKLFFILLNIFLLKVANGQLKPQGSYVGLERMKSYFSSKKPKHIWYHLSILTFEGDSVFLEQSPVAIYKNDTIFSASDGGFYSYKGTFAKYEGKILIDLKLVSCDYCPQQFIKFTPPKIVKDEDTSHIYTADTITASDEAKVLEYPVIKSKIMILEQPKNLNTLIVDKNIYRRKADLKK